MNEPLLCYVHGTEKALFERLSSLKNKRNETGITCFFYKQRFFSIQPKCCVTFSWIDLQMLLRCCLIHVSMIILRHVLYLLFSCPCLDLGLFMSYLCDLFFFFIFIFVIINRIISWIQTHLFFFLFIEYVLLLFGW